MPEQTSLRAKLELFMEKYLPERVFLTLVKLYRVVKIRLTAGMSALIYAYRAGLNKNRIRILDLDLYGWTGMDYISHIKEKFADGIVLLRREKIWELYETEAGTDLQVDTDNYLKLSHGGLSLWELGKVSIMKHLGRVIIPGITEVGEEELKCITRYYNWAVNCYDIIRRELRKHRPDRVVITQGGVYDSRIITELCRSQGIKVIALENSFSADHFIADDLSGQILNRHSIAVTGGFIQECEVIDAREQEKTVLDFLSRVINNKAEDHYSGPNTGPAALRRSLSIPDNKKLILYLGQVRTDASILLDSTLYPDPILLLEDLARMAGSRDDCILMIRLHPKEATGDRVTRNGNHHELCRNLTLQDLERSDLFSADNIRIISDRSINTYDLMQLSNVGITINSQSGLEMALLGKQVITAGRCIYAGKGFTWDVDHKSMLEQTVNAAIKHQYTGEEYGRLIAFCDYYFNHYLISKDLSMNAKRLYSLFGLN